MIAKIAVAAANFAIDKPYSYRIPMGMVLQSGVRVTVPFGRGNRLTEGIVLEVVSGDGEALKPIAACLDEEPLLSNTMLRLAAFMRHRYFCTMYDAVRAMLPAGLWFQTKQTYNLTADESWRTAQLRQKDAALVLETMQALGGSAKDSELRQVIADEERLEKAVSYLLRKKWIATETDFQRKTNDKTQKIATLAAPVEEVMAYAAARPRSAAMQRAVLETMCAVGSVAVKELCYYTGASVATVKRLESLGYMELTEAPLFRCREIQPAVLDGPLVLNSEQEAAFAGMTEQMNRENPGVALLYGVTGSGKTAVYIHLIRQCLAQGKSAIFLVPEIALTPQLLGLMAAHFGDTVAVLHSSLPATERYDQWKRIRTGQARLVVGTRSAVFAPCVAPGMIILDEEQEHSYKSENSPRYAAREVAFWRGIKENALVVLGSATPSVEAMYHARQGDYQLYQLKGRYNGRPLPKVDIVDMREELKDGNDSSFSIPLIDSIVATKAAGKQTVLFLNRRGNSRSLVCVDCREAPECPRCSARLTYHSANQRLMCHYCGHSQSVPQVCPACGGALKSVGTGTQKVQQELQDKVPGITVERMDADTVSAVNTHEKILAHFQNAHMDVLLGTQMVVKGLNLPDVTLVGVLDADLSLYTGSYRSAETTFNMLTQVVGRAGRGEDAGRAIIQTMVPGHRVIDLASRQDYDGFYEMEIEMRRLQQVPPFADVTLITFTGQNEAAVLRGASKFRDGLAASLNRQDALLLGPAPCPVPKINFNYRYRLTLRCTMDNTVRGVIAQLLRQFSQDRSNRGVSAFADVNGFD